MKGNNKRPCDESHDQPKPSQIRRVEPNNESDNLPEPSQARPRPVFFDVIRGAIIAEIIKKICSAVEPIVRETVKDEVRTTVEPIIREAVKDEMQKIVEPIIREAVKDEMQKIVESTVREAVRDEVQKIHIGPHGLYGNRQYYIENPQLVQQDPRFQLVFAKQVPESIFTCNQITHDDENPIQIHLIDVTTGAIRENGEGSSAKVRIVVIDGGLEEERFDRNTFNNNIVQPREGKPALLSGKTVITLKNGVGNLEGVSFTDNSKWSKSGNFRLGVHVETEASTSTSTTNGINIKEGLSKKFAVKDHRGQANQKHYPPKLDDPVWRLKSIARDGKYHKRLSDGGINNIQDFLRFFLSRPDELKTIMEMAKNAWEKVIKHAKTCEMGQDSYLFKSEGDVIKFNPVGQILEAFIRGRIYKFHEIPSEYEFDVQWLVSQASQQWSKLDKVPTHLPLNGGDNSNILPNGSIGYGNWGNLETDMPSSSTPRKLDSFVDTDFF